MAKKSVGGMVLKKASRPKNIYEAYKKQRNRRDRSRSVVDPQLKMISRICPGDFLNYGHFENTELQGEDVSVNDILRAQTLNAELLVGLIRDGETEILDAGCGMGGVTRLLQEKGLKPTALTPNRYQLENVRLLYPNVPLIEAKFEDMPYEEYLGHFDVVLMSESLQYMDLDGAFPVVDAILKPEGRWLVVDFFRTDELGERSGQLLSRFEEKLAASGWRIDELWDHTANVLPLLRYIHMLGNDLLRPIFEFAFEKLQEQQPGFHFLIEDAVDELFERGEKGLSVIDPEKFAAHKKYLLITIVRA